MSKRKINVLIAEDDAVISLDLKTLFENNNYIVSARVTYGDDLIDKYKLAKPDLIVADIKLKGQVSVMDAIKEIKKITDIPIIIISGTSRSELNNFVSTISNCEYLEKPFDQYRLIFLANKFFNSFNQKQLKLK